MDIGRELRRAISDSGLTLYRIAKDAGVPYPTLHDFYRGRFELRVTTANPLLQYLGFELVRKTAPAKKKPAKRRKKYAAARQTRRFN